MNKATYEAKPWSNTCGMKIETEVESNSGPAKTERQLSHRQPLSQVDILSFNGDKQGFDLKRRPTGNKKNVFQGQRLQNNQHFCQFFKIRNGLI